MIKSIAKITVAAAALAGMQLATALPAHAQATGFGCGFTSITDPTGEGDVQTGEIDGGPLVAEEPGASISITCTIQVGATGATHAGPDAASASATGTGAVVLAPTLVSYVSPDGADVYMCEQITITTATGTTTYYWDDATGAYVLASSSACAKAISQDVPPQEGPVHEIGLLVDSVICPVLAVAFPPEGDIAGIWDCPPYGNA